MPVHPTLGAMLAEWRLKGWVEMMGRVPKPEDLIVPMPEGPRVELGKMRSKNDSYKRLCTDLGELGLRHRRGHDLRRTMISLTRTDGARKDLLELCTHTPRKQSTIDVYTEFPWESLCGEVAKLKIHREVRGEVIPLRRAVNADVSSGEDEGDGKEPGEAATDSSMILARLATPSGNREELRQVRQWRRRESNPLDGISDESGLDALNRDSTAEQAGADGSASPAVGVENGLSASRCSNVANLLKWALEALAGPDLDRAREALVVALDLVSTRPDGQPR
jgi:hypothetical protein